MKLRIGLAAALACAALASCGQSAPGAEGAQASSNPAAEAAAAMFPNLFSASYRAEARVHTDEGDRQVTIYRAGKKQRMELDATTAIVSDLDAQQGMMIRTEGGRATVMRMTLDNDTMRDAMASWLEGRTTTRVGPCMGAGQVGTQWSIAPTEEEPGQQSTCVTDDGIILKAERDGAVVWETTSVARGPQDPALFAAPEGAQVIDLSAMGAQMRAMAEKARSGH